MSFLPSGVVTLMSDLGLEEPSVGILKGAMMSRFAQIRIVDLCHAVPQKDTVWASYALAGSYRDFPPGTVHCVVVGPGRGSATNVLVALRRGHAFVAPNNGCLTKILGERDNQIWRVDVKSLPVAPIRRTYHTRDVVASIGALVASGKLGLADVGPEETEVYRSEGVEAACSETGIEGVILGEDIFGNFFASISDSDLPDDAQTFVVEYDGKQIPMVRSIHEAEPGKPAAMFNYFGMLQLVERDGRASESLRAERGSPIRVTWS